MKKPLHLFWLSFSLSILISATSQAITIDDRIESILKKMTMTEKIKQLHQEGGFNTADNTRLNVPGFQMADGPHGVREGQATCFPVGIAMAATWDPDLCLRIGEALGQEFRGKGKHQGLGPCMDLGRDPRNGRAPESGGEDPYLDAQITTAVVKGMQSTPCIATIKHYNLNNREDDRHNRNCIIDQRGLLEQYGLVWRTAVQEGGALCVMNAYNLVNNDKSAESYNILTEILRQRWGFAFYVVSDWGSIWDSEKAIKAGCDVCMGSTEYQDDLPTLVSTGRITQSTINEAVRHVLRTKLVAGMLDTYPAGNPEDVDSPAHRQLCYEAGQSCLVLLKNQDRILPLNKKTIKKIALIGPNADQAQTDGTGSSWVTPSYSVTPRAGIERKVSAGTVLYSKGCDINSTSTSGFTDAKNKAQQSDVVVFIGGLDTSQEGEGADRNGGSVALPGKQQDLINELAVVNKNIIVVLYSGGICGVNRCIDNIKGLVYAWYPGQEGGNAVADVLFGDYNPGGKLPVTMPTTDSQLPPRDDNFNNDYGCGYRWFDQKKYVPQFAFGYGLSYTTFSYANLAISPVSAPAGKLITVNVDVTNTGSRSGDEVVQLYVTDNQASVPMPVKQLKAFKRISLNPGETRAVSFTLTNEAFYYYDESSSSYRVEPGSFTVRIGGSSDNLPMQGQFELTSASPKPDLVITDIKPVPPFPMKGDSVIFAAIVKNQGTGPSPAGTNHELTFYIDGEKISWSTRFNNAIPAAGSAFICADAGQGGVNWWLAPDIIGKHSITACIDEQQSIDEIVEDNNEISEPISVHNPPPVNLALKKSVKVSSIEKSGLEGELAVDGNSGTRWSSQFSDPQWLQIDFGAVTPFNRVIINWEAAYGKEYKLEVSDNASKWTALEHVTNSDGGIDAVSVNAQSRYLRMYGIQRGTQYGYSIFELQVFNSSDTSVTGDDSLKTPSSYELCENYPNPFNAATTIPYRILKPGNVKIRIYNIAGQQVRTLVDHYFEPGLYSAQWNGRDSAGQTVTTGVYLYRMECEGFDTVKKMMYVR
jgi:beta-glucosidase